MVRLVQLVQPVLQAQLVQRVPQVRMERMA
jgi:hypothetical protein